MRFNTSVTNTFAVQRRVTDGNNVFIFKMNTENSTVGRI